MINTKVKVNVPGYSGFDKSFKNILTTKVGTITPLCCKYVMPGAKGKLKLAISASLPPLASDTFMRAALKCEAFLIPMRLLYGGFESWLTGQELVKNSSGTITYVTAKLPRLSIEPSDWTSYANSLGPGSLLDYLDFRPDLQSQYAPTSKSYYNIFPLLAYHRAYDDWYRNARVQTPLFSRDVDQGNSFVLTTLPYDASSTVQDIRCNASFLNGHYLMETHQRNYGDDYFTIATPAPQMGNAQAIAVTSNQFTISALRAGNSLQQFAERSNLASPRMQDYVKAHFGADLSSGVAQRAILLGSASYEVYSKGVEANSTSTATNNPFTSVGSRYGNAYASGTDFVCEFECNEPSYLLINATLVPEANYSIGISREFSLLNADGSQVDLPDPLLENTGNEPIYRSEVDGERTGSASGNPLPGAVFGYVPKYTWYKSNHNQVHGLLISGQSLDSFVAQRYFALSGTAPVIGSNFLEIPTTALDNVTAVTADLSNYGVWIDSFIDLKVSEPLQESAMPSLQDPAYEHGRGVSLHLGGSKL